LKIQKILDLADMSDTLKDSGKNSKILDMVSKSDALKASVEESEKL